MRMTSSNHKADYEGTIVLEKLNEIDKVDEFYEAIDSDNFSKAKSLMRQAGLDADTIEQTLVKMRS